MTVDDEQPQWLREMREREMAQFPIGQEVVVRLNGECRRGALHGEQEDGVRGTVIATGSTFRGAAHPIVVLFRRPLPVQGQFGYYTPGELEPFDIMAESERLKAAQAATTEAS